MWTAVVTCLLSVVTTIGIHSKLFDFGSLSKIESINLFENKHYLFFRFWIIFHCVFVLISMAGVRLILHKTATGFGGLGFVFFTVFAFTEIFRQMYVLFYINGLRKSYWAIKGAEQALVLSNIDTALLFGYALFGLFICCFALGNISFGLAIWGNHIRDKVFSTLLIFWGIVGLLAFCNEFWAAKALGTALEKCNLFFQPMMRFLFALWMLWKMKMKAPINSSMSLSKT